jgi:hypothetical protein
MGDLNATQIWGLVLGIVGTVTGVISLCWQIARQIITDRQSLTLHPDSLSLGKPRSAMTVGGAANVIHPTKFYVKCSNTGRRRIVIDEVRVVDAKTNAQLGKRYLRNYDSQKDRWRSDSGGLGLEVEELRVLEIDLVGDSDHFVPTSESQGSIEAVTSRGRKFHSSPFSFRDLMDQTRRSIVET